MVWTVTAHQLRVGVLVAFVAAASWWIGMLAGEAALDVTAARSGAGVDTTTFAVIAAATFGVGVGAVYLPAVERLHRRRPLARSRIVHALGLGAVLSLVPWIVTMILLTAGTFHGMFDAAGMTLLIVSAVSGSLFTAGALAVFGWMRQQP